MLPKKKLWELLTIPTTTIITPPEACDHSPGMPVSGFPAQVPVCKSRGGWSMTASNLCPVPLGEELVLPKINSMLAGPWRFVLSFTAVGAASLTAHVYHGTAQNNAVSSKRDLSQVCPSVHAGTESQGGSSAVGEFMASESSSTFSQHRNPLLTHISALLGPVSGQWQEWQSTVWQYLYHSHHCSIWGVQYKYRVSNSQGSPKSGEEGEWPRQLRRDEYVHLPQLSSAAGCHGFEIGKIERTYLPLPFNSSFSLYFSP